MQVRQLGHLCLYELLAAQHDVKESFDLFTYDDIDAAFDGITGMRFSQQAAVHRRAGSEQDAGVHRLLPECPLTSVHCAQFLACFFT